MAIEQRIKDRAIALRKQGLSYNEISQQLKIAKSTCSIWLRNIRLEKDVVDTLIAKQDKGRMKANLVLRQYIQERDQAIQNQVQKTLNGFTVTPAMGKILCSVLYWAEGEKSKSVLAFTNSDPNMIRVYLSLLREHFLVHPKKFKAVLHLHKYHDVKRQQQYWSKITAIPVSRISVYMKKNSGKSFKEGYPGCISIRYADVRLAKEMAFLYNALVNKIGSVG